MTSVRHLNPIMVNHSLQEMGSYAIIENGADASMLGDVFYRVVHQLLNRTFTKTYAKLLPTEIYE